MTRRIRLLGLLVGAAFGTGCVSERVTFAREPFDTADPPPGPLNGLWLTTNSGDDTLTAVAHDEEGLAVRFRIPVGFVPVELEGPHHAVADPSGRYVYLNLSLAVTGAGSGPHGTHGGGTADGYVLKMSTADSSVEAYARVPPNPGDLALTADGKTLYVTHYDVLRLAQAGNDLARADSNLTVIDTASMGILRSFPVCPLGHGVRLSRAADAVYISCGTDMIAVASSTITERERLVLPGGSDGPACTRCPYGLAVAPDGAVWVAALGANNGLSGGGAIYVYDPSTKTFDLARTLSLCGRALFPAFSADTAYVPEQGPCGDFVRMYSLGRAHEAPRELGVIPLPREHCFNAHMLEVRGRYGYLVCEGDHRGPGSLVLLDLEEERVVSHVPTGVFPDGLTHVPLEMR